MARENIKHFLLYGTNLDLNGFGLLELPHMIPKKKIIHLDIGNNNINPSSLENMPNVEILHCQMNKLKRLPDFPNLKELYCMRNDISELPAFECLEKLHCQDNFITHIPTMPNIKEIRCMDNPLLSIAFQPKLEILYISMNNIQDLPILPRLRNIIIHNFSKFMSYHALEDTCNMRSVVIKQKIRYLRYYIHVVKMQRRFRRNYLKKILNPFVYDDINKKIVSYII